MGWLEWNGPMREHGSNVCCISKFVGECWCWFSQVLGYLGWGWGLGGGECCLAALTFLVRILKDPCPSSMSTEFNKYLSFTYTPGNFDDFFSAVSQQDYMLCPLFKGRNSVFNCPPTLPEPSPLIFKMPRVKQACCV